MIQQVLPDSAAARAGLKPGDLVIGVDNSGVTGPDDIVQRIGKHSSGESIALMLLRPNGQGQVRQFQVRAVLQPAGTGFAPGQPVSQPTQSVPPGSPSASALPPQLRSTPSPLGTRFTGSALPVRVMFNTYHTCLAVAPANWIIYGDRREGDALDIAAPDGSMAASWGSRGVPGFMVRAYPNRNATPEIAIHSALSGSLTGHNYPVSYGQPMRDDFGYTWLPYELGNPNDPAKPSKGVVIYRVWPIAGDPLGYIMISRIAQTAKGLWERQGAQAIAVALSIRCTVQLRPPSGGGGSGGSEDDKVESTYNQQLGMEYAHDAATGENYWMSSADWKDDGPEGPGYYKSSGNDLRKLVQGRSN